MKLNHYGSKLCTSFSNRSICTSHSVDTHCIQETEQDTGRGGDVNLNNTSFPYYQERQNSDANHTDIRLIQTKSYFLLCWLDLSCTPVPSVSSVLF